MAFGSSKIPEEMHTPHAKAVAPQGIANADGKTYHLFNHND